MHRLIEIAKKVFAEAAKDEVTRLAAAVAFYAVLSLAPLALLTLAIIQMLFGEAAARGELASAMHAFTGPRTASALEYLIANAAESELEVKATLVGVAVALTGASGVFYQLKVAMNIIWDVPERRSGGWKRFLRQRLWAIVFAALAIVFILFSAFATSVLGYVQRVTPEARWGDAAVWRTAAFLLTVALYSLLFSAVFRYMPDVELKWRHVWQGGIVTAVFAALAQYVVGIYAARSMVASAYGAAGSIVVVLLWIYATALILFVGGEVTEVLSHEDRALARQRRERQDEEDHEPRKPLPPP